MSPRFPSRLAWIGLILGVLLLPAAPAVGQDRETVTIGTITDGPFGRGFPEASAVRDQLVELLEIDFEVQLPPASQIEADWTVTGIRAGLDQLMADPDLDLILTLGYTSSHLAATRATLPTPTVAALVIDRVSQGLPLAEPGTGVDNLNYISIQQTSDLRRLLESTTFEHVDILTDARLVEVIPDLEAQVAANLQGLPVELRIVPVGASVDAALGALSPDADAVYILPLLQLDSTQFLRLVAGLNERQLPSMSWIGQREVEEGAMLGLKPSNFPTLISRRVGLNAQRALLGDPLSEMEVDYPTSVRLTLNLATATAIGYSPSYVTLSEAELFDAETPGTRQLSLDTAVREAVAENLDLLTEDAFLRAAAQNQELAGAARLPQVDLSLDGSTIDENRAARSLGSLPQHLLSGSAVINQAIYREDLWADVEIEQFSQDARVLDRETLSLDIGLEAAFSYLALLRAKTFERIERDNLSLTRSNLELGQLRVSVGTAAPGEVFRWENQIANSRRSLVEAAAETRVTTVELNRLLNDPLDRWPETEETALDDPQLLSSQERFQFYVDNPRNFDAFREFMALEAAARSPELRSLDSRILAQERALSATGKANWLPDFGAQGGVTGLFLRGGEGSGQHEFVLPGLEPVVIPEPSSFQWFAGAFATFPLFEGTAKSARQTQAGEELGRLRLAREATAQRVDERLRTSLYRMQASLLGVDLARQAADAARSNLTLVTDTYRRGAAGIIDLLDAQSASFQADQEAASAIYQFLLDLMRVQRAVNRFDFFLEPADTADFFMRLDSYYRQVTTRSP